MKSGRRSGFTMIEIMLFLAITGLILVGVITGVSGNIDKQRYTDSIQAYADFLRGVYSEVSNTEGQDSGGGRSERAVYGKLVTFGEAYDMNGAKNSDGNIYVYDVVGDIVSNDALSGSDVLKALASINASPLICTSIINNTCKAIGYSGNAREYRPEWGAKIQTTSASKPNYRGAILIVRSPSSGQIHTYVYHDNNNLYTIEVNGIRHKKSTGNYKTVLTSKLSGFKMDEVHFCIATNGYKVYNDKRRDIRIVKDAHNASGIEIIALDNNETNRCEE